MTAIPPLVLADLLRAYAALQPKEDGTRREIARLLGVEITPENRLVPPTPEPKSPTPSPPLPSPKFPARASAPLSTPQVEHGPAAPTQSEISAVLIPNWASSRRPPDWLEQVPPLEPEPTGKAPPPGPEDRLLVPLWTRAVLSSALSVLSESGPLDLAALVRRVARGESLRQIPRRPWPTLAHGVQVLVDRSDAMLPFMADQNWLLERIRSVAGEDRLQVLSFEGSPSWGAGPGTVWEWKDYFEDCCPLHGVTVLALTDLGIGNWGTGSRPVHPSEWRVFADRLRQAGCPLVALVPYGKDRWPKGLARCMKILHLDPTTSARQVRRVVGRGLRLPGGPRP